MTALSYKFQMDYVPPLNTVRQVGIDNDSSTTRVWAWNLAVFVRFTCTTTSVPATLARPRNLSNLKAKSKVTVLPLEVQPLPGKVKMHVRMGLYIDILVRLTSAALAQSIAAARSEVPDTNTNLRLPIGKVEVNLGSIFSSRKTPLYYSIDVNKR